MGNNGDKWTETRNLLIQRALRKPIFGSPRPTLRLEELETDIQRLTYVLNEVSEGDPRVFSLSLQSFLAGMEIEWPDGVFQHDFAFPSRGRPLSCLSFDSWHMYVKQCYGWRSVAKELIPEEYQTDPDEATKKVRKAASSFKRFRRTVECSLVPPSGRIQELLDEIVWIIGLDEISFRVVDRQVVAATYGHPERLQLVTPPDKDRWKPANMSGVRNKWTETRNSLIQRALRKNIFGTRGRPRFCLEELEADIQRLIYVLNKVSAGEPRVFSLSLQSFLAFMGIGWPDGVFKHDFAFPSRGRSLSRLSIDSWVMHVKYGYGWKRVAKNLIPAEYSRDSEKAAKKVREAAARFNRFRQSVENSILSRSKKVRKLLDQIVWLDGLQEIFYRVVQRKFTVALQGHPVELPHYGLGDQQICQKSS